ncbi:MAG TPA: beta-galactosidase, partial [Candidatus Eisenbergiella pullistercoris]|nr:beta-galactosidase [Candidatus Eisenbergiella pullistercoris]
MYLSGKEARKKENFNRDWYFFHEKETASGKLSGTGKQPVPGETGTEGFRPVKLPHDWSLDYPFAEDAPSCGSGGYAETGIGWYRKLFCVDPEAVRAGRVILRFDGAYMLARVWLNGKELGRHVYGYTPFEWDVTELLKTDGEENIVDVEVDNSAQPNSRWYSGSGITRDVWLIGVKPVHIAPYGVCARGEEATEEKASLIVETRIAGADEGMAGKIGVEISVYAPDGTLCASGQAEACGQVTCAKQGELTFVRRFDISRPALWSCESPAQYRVETVVRMEGEKQDEVSILTGIRSVAFDCDQGFLINGKREKLNGVCVHHDGGSMGAAVPAQIWERRLEKLKNMGVNAIRMSHNPPDSALLDLCDRMGFYVMDEAFDEWRILKGKELGSNTHESRGYSEWFDECHEEDLTVMLLRDRNHPSIVIWSIGNEVPDQTDPEGYLTARSLKALCKKLVPGCYVTQANDQICAEPR